MSVGGQDLIWLLTFKGSHRHRHEQLGIGIPTQELNFQQQSLRTIARKQNFVASSEPERPDWAGGAIVFVTVEHAAEIREAIAESEVELQSHHVLVSGKYRKLVEDLLQTPVGNTTRDKYQSSRKGVIKGAEPVASKTFSHTASAATTGPVDYIIAQVPLRMRRTFLEYDATSEDSRKTRTTGDRPLKVAPSSKSNLVGEDLLPPRDADYGLNRKKFHLQALNRQEGFRSNSSCTAGASQERANSHESDDWAVRKKKGMSSKSSCLFGTSQEGHTSHDADDLASPIDIKVSNLSSFAAGPSQEGDMSHSNFDMEDLVAKEWGKSLGETICDEEQRRPSVMDSGTDESVNTEDLEDIPEMPSADHVLIEGLKERYRKDFEALDGELSGLVYLGDPASEQLEDISKHLMCRADICMRIFADFMKSTSLSPAHTTASSALEAPEERTQSLKILLRLLRGKAVTLLTAIQPCLRIDSVFGDTLYGNDEFGPEMESQMQKKLKQLQTLSGLSTLARAESSSGGLELDALKKSTETLLRSVLRSSFERSYIQEILEILSKKRHPMPWKLTEISEEEEDEEEELTPQERYEMRKQKAKARHIAKMTREENRERRKPHKRGVPGALPRRGKHVG